MLIALSVLHRAYGGIWDVTPNTICLFQLSDSPFWWYLFICSKVVDRVCTWGTRQLPGVSQSYRQFEPPLVCSMLSKLCSGVACVGEEVEKCWSRARQKQIAGWLREVSLFIALRLKTAVYGYLPLLENLQCSHNEKIECARCTSTAKTSTQPGRASCYSWGNCSCCHGAEVYRSKRLHFKRIGPVLAVLNPCCSRQKWCCFFRGFWVSVRSDHWCIQLTHKVFLRCDTKGKLAVVCAFGTAVLNGKLGFPAVLNFPG